MKKWMLLLLVSFFLAYPLFLMQVSGRSGEEGSQPSPGAALADHGAEMNSSWGTNQVTTAWARRYNGTGNGYDKARAIALDSQGNVYVTGTSEGSSTGFDYTTLKYSPSGQLLWARRYHGLTDGGGNASAGARAIALDSQRNVYITGSSWGGTTQKYDYATLKYSPSGQLLWARRYDGLGNGWDEAHGMALDGQGNVYVTGISGESYVWGDYATLKYSPSGQLLWTRRYNGPANMTDETRAIAVDPEGNACVIGRSGQSLTDYDFATLKYSPSGQLLWARRYDGPGNGWDEPRAVALDNQGNVYVTGHSQGSGTFQDFATLKYSPSGQLLWARRYNGPGNGWDGAYDLALDGQGNVYVTGTSEGSSTGLDFATLKYSPSGQLLWARRYDGPGNGYNEARAIALDSQGNVYVTGSSCGGTTQKYDFATLKYSPSGQLLWARRYDGPGNGYDKAHAIALDSLGNVYVTGEAKGLDSWTDYLTIRYTQNPQENQ